MLSGVRTRQQAIGHITGRLHHSREHTLLRAVPPHSGNPRAGPFLRLMFVTVEGRQPAWGEAEQRTAELHLPANLPQQMLMEAACVVHTHHLSSLVDKSHEI